jgi:hypothetical protein
MANVTVTPGYVWTSGETVTPTKLNAAATLTATATLNDGEVTNVKLSSGIDAGKLTVGTLPIARIADGAVNNAKLANDIDASKLTTGTLPIARIADGAVTNNKLSLAANAGEIKKALNADNAPPIFACRAWVNFDGTVADNLAGTYTRTGTDVTVSAASHGLIVGSVVRLDFTGGTPTSALDGTYTVTQIDDANTFHVTTAASGTSAGGTVALLRRLIRNSGNVSSVSATASGEHVINFAVAMPSANYAIAEGGAADARIGAGAKQPTAQSFYIELANVSINTAAVFA